MRRTYLVDIGNSAIKWAGADTPQHTGVITYGDNVMLAEQVRDFYISEKPELIYACTVANSEKAQTIREVCNMTRIEFLGSQKAYEGRFRMENRYEDYSKLGPDRWYAALGAVAKHPARNLVIVQMGTAITVDSVRFVSPEEYAYLGGRIAPGPTMMFTSLRAGTARLKGEMGTWARTPLKTGDGIATGIADCIEGVIRGGLRSFDQENEPLLILTGGASHFFEDFYKKFFPKYVIEDNLVITGLSLRVKNERRNE